MIPVEILESRRLFVASVTQQFGTWYIEGTSRADTITISKRYTDAQAAIIQATGQGDFTAATSFKIRINDLITYVDSPFSLAIYSYNGNDRVRIDNTNGVVSASVRVFGGAGNDTITTAGANDHIHGDEGDDKIDAGSGRDRIYGDDGNDFIQGAGGNDKIYGGLGNDTIEGNKGKDYLVGEDGDDVIFGGIQEDDLIGGVGIDTLFGQGSNDDFDKEIGDTTDFTLEEDAGSNGIGQDEALP